MLVEEMTVTEINNAIMHDFEIFKNSSTQTRLEHQYFERRKMLKIA